MESGETTKSLSIQERIEAHKLNQPPVPTAESGASEHLAYTQWERALASLQQRAARGETQHIQSLTSKKVFVQTPASPTSDRYSTKQALAETRRDLAAVVKARGQNPKVQSLPPRTYRPANRHLRAKI